MWLILETNDIQAAEPRVEVMLDNFRPNPGFTYEGRTVFLRLPRGTEFTTKVVECRQHPDTWSFILPIQRAMAPPGSYFRFLSHGVLVE